MPEQIEGLLALSERDLPRDREQAVLRLEQAVAFARALDDPDVLARTLHEAAVGLQRAQRPDRAFVMCLEAQPTLERLDDAPLALRLVLLRGACFLDVGQFDRAQQLIAEAAEGFAARGDVQMLGHCQATLARACGLSGDLPAAVEQAMKAVSSQDAAAGDADLRRRWRHDEARWRMLLAEQLAADGDDAGARAQWQRAAALLPDVPDARAGEADALAPDDVVALDTAAAVFGALGDLPRGRCAIKRLVGAARASRLPVAVGLAWMRLGDFHATRGQRSRAIACARRAVRCLPASLQAPNRLTAERSLARLLEAAGDGQGAYEAQRSASVLETRLEKQAVMVRAELLALDLEAEQEQRHSAQTLQYAQRLSKVGQVVAGINHDLNQPLASIKMLAETSIDMLGVDPHARIQQDVAVMHDLAASVVDLIARLPAMESRTADGTSRVGMRWAIDEALSIVGARLESCVCHVLRDVPDVDVQAAGDRLVDVLAQLMNNALDAMRAQPTPRLSLQGRCEGGLLKLRLEDAGPGINAPAQERLFQPFNSTRPNQLGIGLALSRDALRDMGGELTASAANADDGASLCVSLKLVQGLP